MRCHPALEEWLGSGEDHISIASNRRGRSSFRGRREDQREEGESVTRHVDLDRVSGPRSQQISAELPKSRAERIIRARNNMQTTSVLASS